MTILSCLSPQGQQHKAKTERPSCKAVITELFSFFLFGYRVEKKMESDFIHVGYLPEFFNKLSFLRSRKFPTDSHLQTSRTIFVRLSANLWRNTWRWEVDVGWKRLRGLREELVISRKIWVMSLSSLPAEQDTTFSSGRVPFFLLLTSTIKNVYLLYFTVGYH